MRELNLSTYHYPDRRITWVFYSLLTVVALLLTISNGYFLFSEKEMTWKDDLSGLRNEVKLLREEIKSYGDEGKGGPGELAMRVENINELLERKAFSWSALFYSLEKVHPKGISVTGIKPTYSDKKIKLSGVARNFEDLSDFVEKLRESEYIEKSFLLSESAVLVDNMYPAISFEIEATGAF